MGGRWTALHQAAQAGDRETVRFLISRGADRRLTNSNGQTPLDVAHARVRSLLRDAREQEEEEDEEEEDEEEEEEEGEESEEESEIEDSLVEMVGGEEDDEEE